MINFSYITNKKKMNGLSLFSNIGIGETFLSKNNITIKVANELLPKRADIYKFLYPETDIIVGDIQNSEILEEIIRKSLINKCEFIIATPPCQGMSVAGKRIKSDERNLLIKYVVNVVQKLNPKYVLIENVPKLKNTSINVNGEDIDIMSFIESNLKDYNIKNKIIDCSDYGIPQNRKRIFILLSRKDIKLWDFNLVKENKKSIKDIIGHLPSIESGEKTNIKYHYAITHNENHILWMKNTPTGKTAFDNLIHYPKINNRKIKAYRSSYRRLKWNNPCSTITTNSNFISSQNNVHPGRLNKDGTYSDARCLTPLELILITGLPNDWHIPDWVSDKLLRTVIGEAIPPKIIYEITKELKNVT